MSEVMLHGVLNMPIDLWRDDELDKVQRHSRYVEASETIRQQQAEISRLTEQRDSILDADKLAEIIRKVDGSHNLGAGALAEALIAEIEAGK